MCVEIVLIFSTCTWLWKGVSRHVVVWLQIVVKRNKSIQTHLCMILGWCVFVAVRSAGLFHALKATQFVLDWIHDLCSVSKVQMWCKLSLESAQLNRELFSFVKYNVCCFSYLSMTNFSCQKKLSFQKTISLNLQERPQSHQLLVIPVYKLHQRSRATFLAPPECHRQTFGPPRVYTEVLWGTFDLEQFIWGLIAALFSKLGHSLKIAHSRTNGRKYVPCYIRYECVLLISNMSS